MDKMTHKITSNRQYIQLEAERHALPWFRCKTAIHSLEKEKGVVNLRARHVFISGAWSLGEKTLDPSYTLV